MNLRRNPQIPQELQLEVAILQKKILAFKPCYANIIIPALMGNDADNYISVPMPLHLSITYGDIVIPKDTKLLVQTIAGNYNDIRIVGFYDEPMSFNFIDFIKGVCTSGNTLPEDYGVFEYDEI
jgi:hypothetical protein